jgi:hypothetical protein
MKRAHYKNTTRIKRVNKRNFSKQRTSLITLFKKQIIVLNRSQHHRWSRRTQQNN